MRHSVLAVCFMSFLKVLFPTFLASLADFDVLVV